MKINHRIVTTLAALALSACGGGAAPDSPIASASATYRVTFHTDWTQAAFPTMFPADRHFSGLVGATHNNSVAFWEDDRLASRGIQNMAERGQKTALLDEVAVAQQAGHAESALSGGGIAATETDVVLEFTITQTHPLVTLVSMVAPSPDWFVGVSGIALFQNGEWASERRFDLEPWDAGSDGGVTFLSADLPLTPRPPISRIVTAPLSPSGRVTALGTFTFTRVP